MKKSSKSGYLVGMTLAAAALLAGVVVFGSVACNRDALQRGLAGPVPNNPETLLAELKNDKGRIDQISDQMMKRIETFNQSRREGERQVQFSELFYDDLSGEQRDVLNTLLAEEKDLSYRSLLEGIIQDRNTIQQLQERVLHLEQTLPDQFVLARAGDSHEDLAMEFLTAEAKLDEAKAKEMLKDVDLSDELLPGNKVWFFHDAGRDTFRTYITQGEAGRTPLAVRRALKRQLITERDEAVARNTVLQETNTQLENDKVVLESDIASLSERRSLLESEVASLQQDRTNLTADVHRLDADLAFRKNSLFYHAESERDLRERGVLTTVLKRVRDVKGVDFEAALDLRKSTAITLDPGSFGLARIKEVKVLPEIYQAGRDFSVETDADGMGATLTILDPEIFRGKEVILSVRG